MADEQRDSSEYIEASANFRHEDNIFFANTTVFSTITGALLAFLFYKQPAPTPDQQFVAYLAGVLTATCFWMSAEVYLYRGHWFMSRAADLERRLGYFLYRNMLERSRRVRPGSWGWRSLFGSVTGFWIFNALAHFHLGSAIAATAAIVLPVVFQLLILLGSRVPKLANVDE